MKRNITSNGEIKHKNRKLGIKFGVLFVALLFTFSFTSCVKDYRTGIEGQKFCTKCYGSGYVQEFSLFRLTMTYRDCESCVLHNIIFQQNDLSSGGNVSFKSSGDGRLVTIHSPNGGVNYGSGTFYDGQMKVVCRDGVTKVVYSSDNSRWIYMVKYADGKKGYFN